MPLPQPGTTSFHPVPVTSTTASIWGPSGHPLPGVSAGIHSGQIAITTLAEFEQGRGYRIQHHRSRVFNREESIDRAYSRLGGALQHAL